MNAPPPLPAPRLLALSVRLAFRELRGGLKGFYVFLACLALGVAAISGVGSLSRALSQGLVSQGQSILGGDVSASRVHRQATAEDRAFFAASGKVSEVASLRAMARLPQAAGAPARAQTLVEIKAVDGAYPLYGELELGQGGDPASAPARALLQILAPRGGGYGAAAEPALLARLGLKPGDRIKVGDMELEVRAAIASEPDRLSSGLSIGPRLMISLDALAASGLVRPGSLVTWDYRIRLPETRRGAEGIASFTAEAEARGPRAGWRIRSRAGAAPGLQRSIDRLAQILTLVGLTVLVVGGVGIANAVRGHLDARRATIATYKCLGAPARAVFLVYLIEIAIIACGGILAGLLAGAALPGLAGAALHRVIPLPLESGLYGGPLALAALYGLLIALAFSLWPLGAARDVAAGELMRDAVANGARHPRLRYMAGAAGALALLAAAAVATASDTRIAYIYLGVTVATLVLLRLLAFCAVAAARAAPRIHSAEIRLALANIGRPGGLTASVVLSLGLGLTLLVALALIDRNLTRELASEIPQTAPSFFFVDIQPGEAGPFSQLLRHEAPAAAVSAVPMLRGRIVALDGVPVEQIDAPPGARWALNGDRGITYSDSLPEGSRLVAGTWWRAGTDEVLVSFEAELAAALGLKLGSTVTVNVLGRDITARIANLRELEWASFGINFVMVFSPSALAGAPHMMLATLTMPAPGEAPGRSGERGEDEVARAVGEAFPHVTIVRVKEALGQVADIVGQLLWAVRAASTVTILASVLVLAGALAAGHRGRVRDAAILKVLGATRARLITAFAAEYLLLGLVTAAFAVLAGSLSAFVVLRYVMHVGYQFDPWLAAATAAGATAVLIGLGLAANWRLMGLKPAPVLRAL